MFRKLLFFVLLVGGAGASAAQDQESEHVVRGRVLDAQTGEPLPSANIRIEGTWRGTITNADGAFEIALPDVPAELAFRYIGYESERRTIAERSVREIEVRLQPTAIQMPEIVVTGENPAIGIMRCVIDRKQERRAALSSYAAEAYTRFTVSNDTGVVAIIETLSEVFWEKERGMRELVKSRRQTSNLDLDLTDYLPAALLMANLYDDDVPLVGYDFAGVTHPNALDVYRFSLQDTRLLDDRLVYDIAVAPKTRLGTAFSGEISVLADECALLEVALAPGEAFLFPPPVENVDVTLYQQYDSFDGSAWLPVDFRSEMGVDISFGPLLRFPTFKVRQVSRITDYDTEAALPDSLYAEGKFVGMDQAAVAADTLLDRAGVAVPLDEPERMAFASIDSSLTFEKAFEPEGWMTRLPGATNDADADAPNGGETSMSPFELDWLQPRFRFNRVEGFHGGLSMRYDSGRLVAEGTGGWSRELDDPWSYGLSGGVRLGAERQGLVGASWSRGVEPRYRSRLYGAFWASMHSLLGGGDYFDYLRNQKLELLARYDRNRMRITLTGRRETPESVEAATGYDLLGKSGKPRPNPPVGRRRLLSAAAKVRYGDAPGAMFSPFGGQYAELEIERGAVEDAEEGYARFAASAEWRIPTFFSRRLFPNVLALHLTAGARLGDLPVQRFGIVDGGLLLFGAVRTQIGRPYEGDRYVGFFWEHNFQTVPFELLGLQGLARRGYGILIGGAHARTWISPSPFVERPELHLSTEGTHHEITVALNGILGFLQVGFTRRLDEPDHRVSVNLKRFF